MKIIKMGDRYFASIEGKKRGNLIPLKTGNIEVASQRAKEMNLEQVEHAAISGAITRSLLKKLVGDKTVIVKVAIERWADWTRSTYESSNSVANMLSYALAWMRETHVSHTNIDEITEQDLDRWVNKKDDCKANTRKFRLAVLRSLFFFCKEKGYIDGDASLLCSVKYEDLSHEQKEVRLKTRFTNDEYQKVLAWLRLHIRVLLNRSSDPSEDLTETYRFWLAATIIGRHSALRISDIATLQWSSICNDRLIVHTGKKNTRVDIEITDEMREVIDRIPKINKKWCWPDKAIIAMDTSKRSQLPVQFARILKRAGVSNHHFHELRSEKLTELHECGKPIESVAAFAGHKSTSTTKTYIIP